MISLKLTSVVVSTKLVHNPLFIRAPAFFSYKLLKIFVQGGAAHRICNKRRLSAWTTKITGVSSHNTAGAGSAATCLFSMLGGCKRCGYHSMLKRAVFKVPLDLSESSGEERTAATVPVVEFC